MLHTKSLNKTNKYHYDNQVLGFIETTVAEGAPIIPISAQLKYNIEVVCEYIEKKIPVPLRDFTSMPHLIIIRSFDVNKPGSEVNQQILKLSKSFNYSCNYFNFVYVKFDLNSRQRICTDASEF